MVTECIEWHDNNVSHMPMPLLQIDLILLSFLNIDTILGEEVQVYVHVSKYLSIGRRKNKLSGLVGPDKCHSSLILGCLFGSCFGDVSSFTSVAFGGGVTVVKQTGRHLNVPQTACDSRAAFHKFRSYSHKYRGQHCCPMTSRAGS